MHHWPLTISNDVAALAIKPLEGDVLVEARARLAQLDALDDQRRAREAAKSGLESFAYNTRETFEDREDDIAVRATRGDAHAAAPASACSLNHRPPGLLLVC